MKTIKVSHDLLLSTEQAIDRYHLLAKKQRQRKMKP